MMGKHMRIPMAVCAAVAEVLSGSHATLEALFEAAGAPGPPPSAAHHTKWKVWLFRAGNDPNVDSLAILGNLIEEFMDLPPKPDVYAEEFGGEDTVLKSYGQRRERLAGILEEHGFRYYRGGRVMPVESPGSNVELQVAENSSTDGAIVPTRIEDLLQTLIRGLPRAMYPLAKRRRGASALTFETEYDIQDLLHSHLRPWIADIRPEEYTPSYAGTSTRMDFLLPKYRIVIETKRIRDSRHASKIGDELIIDIEHYRRHPGCDHLWCVVYDPQLSIANPSGLVADLEGLRMVVDGEVFVKVFIVSN